MVGFFVVTEIVDKEWLDNFTEKHVRRSPRKCFNTSWLSGKWQWSLVNGSEVHIDIYDDRMEIYSPGGMPDGSMIQDRDPLTVPSTKRNPVLADAFNRLGYMERKGSGFGKIISGYEFQINYSEGKRS